jgi:putative ABC transport system permease protein
VKAIIRAARGGLGGRRLQAVVIGLVVLACTAASVLALGMLVDTRSPFDHAFAAQHGADVAATVSTSAVSAAALAETTRLSGVTAVAGPFPQASVTADIAIAGIAGSSSVPLTLTGRASPGGPVDDLTLKYGQWPVAANQVAWSQSGPLSGIIQLGSQLKVGSSMLTVTGIANSVTNTSDAWVLPSELAALGSSSSAQMLYRFTNAGDTRAVQDDINALQAALPPAALLSSRSYLDVRGAEKNNVAVWVPFIVAFGVIALVMSVLIVVNVVSGAVVAGTTRIGVLKSIGFSPVQVVASYVLQVAVPALAGCVAGAVCGNLLAMPILSQNATVYGVGALRVPLWVSVLVPLGVLGVTVIAAVLPALRAGRMSAVQAIATGRAPRPSHGYLAHRLLSRLRFVPRPVTIGLGTPFSRPARTFVTAFAVLFGAVAVTFGAGLSTSLDRVNADIRHLAAPVRVNAEGPVAAPGLAAPVSKKGRGPGRGARIFGPQGMTAAQQRTVGAALAANPDTLHYGPETDDQLSVAGLPGQVQVTAFGGDASWAGYRLITGRWYSGPAEADVNTYFLTSTGLSVGDSYPLTSGGHRVNVKIVGEVFAPNSELEMFMSSAALSAVDPGATPTAYAVAVRPGVDPQSYANAVGAALGSGYGAFAVNSNGSEFVAVITLIALLTILLIVVAGLGVLNTVVLQLRERVHDLGVFKSVGMTPRQAIAMVICSVGAVGLIAGIVAVPAGVFVHHGVLPAMGHAANSDLPSSVISVYPLWEIVVLALAGLVIAVAGALGPAGWAARSRTAFALRAE